MKPSASETMLAKLFVVFSQRSATRLNRFSLPKACSMRARPLSMILGKNFGLFLAFDLVGIAGQMPRARAAARFALES